MAKMKVLCVESNPDHLRILKCMLEEQGYAVIPAVTGEQALDVIAEQPIDVVLLEYDLSDPSGTKVRSQMKSMRPEVPVLLFAGVGHHTPMLIRFFDAYLRDAGYSDNAPDSLAG
jgi:DNA-binding NtrC family response regulator